MYGFRLRLCLCFTATPNGNPSPGSKTPRPREPLFSALPVKGRSKGACRGSRKRQPPPSFPRPAERSPWHRTLVMCPRRRRGLAWPGIWGEREPLENMDKTSAWSAELFRGIGSFPANGSLPPQTRRPPRILSVTHISNPKKNVDGWTYYGHKGVKRPHHPSSHGVAPKLQA